MRKAGYDMPTLSSSICTMKFMEKGRKGYYFIPKRTDTANIPICFSEPSKTILIEKLVKYMSNHPQPTSPEEEERLKSFKRTIALMRKKPPNTAWILKWVGCCIPDDEIFSKSYVYVRPKTTQIEEIDYFSNDDDFFTGLPELDDKVIKKTNRMRMSKEQVLAKKLKTVKARQQKDKEREIELLEKAQQLDERSDSSEEIGFFDAAYSPEVPNQLIDLNEDEVDSDFEDSPQRANKRKKKAKAKSSKTKRQL